MFCAMLYVPSMTIGEIPGLDGPGEDVGLIREFGRAIRLSAKVLALAVAVLWGIPLLALAAFLLIR